MITQKIEEQEKLMVDRIEKSDLDIDDKSQLIEQLKCSKEACNGMTPEEKIQALSENGFAVSVILSKIMLMLKQKPPASWKDVALAAVNSWKVVTMVGFLTFLFAMRPEIAEVLKGLAK